MVGVMPERLHPMWQDIFGENVWVRPGTNDFDILRETLTYSIQLPVYNDVKIAVDIGAHIGGWTRYVKMRAPDAQVIAVEPNVGNAELFRLNTQGMKGITLYEARLAYAWKRVVELRDPTNTRGHSFVPVEMADAHFAEWHRRFDIERVGETGAPYVSLEMLLPPGTGDIDVMKVDCEGAEFDLLLNAPISTLQRCRWIVGEVHNLNGDWKAVMNRLAATFIEYLPWDWSRENQPVVRQFTLERIAR